MRLPSRTCVLIPTNTPTDIIINTESIPSMAKKRSLTRIFKRKTTDEATRFYAMHHGVPWTQAYIAELDNDNDDDARLIESFPTIATVDANLGTGRVLDTYFFQPAGWQIEKLAMRFTIGFLHHRE